MFGQPRTIIQPVMHKHRGQLIHFKLLLQSGEWLWNATRLAYGLGAGGKVSVIPGLGLPCMAALFLTVTSHLMHSVARCFSCLTNSTAVAWAWEWRRELLTPSPGAARNRQGAFEVYSWPCCLVRGALTYQLLPGSTGLTRRSWSSCHRKCTGVTEVHVEYSSRGKQSHFSGLFPYW